MRQHTPGPWQWWTSNSLRRLTSHAGGRSGQDGGVLHAYRCRDGVADIAVSDADMSLIAAAPDLYEALRDMCESGGMDDGTDVIAKAKAALAKARGETNS